MVPYLYISICRPLGVSHVLQHRRLRSNPRWFAGPAETAQEYHQSYQILPVGSSIGRVGAMWLGYAESSSTWITWHDRLSMSGMPIHSGGINSLRVLGNLDTKSTYSLCESEFLCSFFGLFPLPTFFGSFWRCLFFSFWYNLVSRAACIAINRRWRFLLLRLTRVLHSPWIYLSSYFEIFSSFGARTIIGYAWRDLSYRAKNISNYYKDLRWPQVA